MGTVEGQTCMYACQGLSGPLNRSYRYAKQQEIIGSRSAESRILEMPVVLGDRSDDLGTCMMIVSFATFAVEKTP